MWHCATASRPRSEITGCWATVYWTDCQEGEEVLGFGVILRSMACWIVQGPAVVPTQDLICSIWHSRCFVWCLSRSGNSMTAVKRLKEWFCPVDIAELKGIDFHQQMQLLKESVEQLGVALQNGKVSYCPRDVSLIPCWRVFSSRLSTWSGNGSLVQIRCKIHLVSSTIKQGHWRGMNSSIFCDSSFRGRCETHFFKWPLFQAEATGSQANENEARQWFGVKNTEACGVTVIPKPEYGVYAGKST